MKLSTFKTFSAPVINYETIGYELIKAAEIRCWVCHIHKKNQKHCSLYTWHQDFQRMVREWRQKQSNNMY